MTLDALCVCYWSLRDPLCQSQSLPVVRGLVREGWRLGFITYEQRLWALPADEEAATRAALAREGIRWIPLRYHKRPPLLSTLFDILAGTAACLSLRRGLRLIHARGTVPAAIAYLASRMLGVRFFDDADGPLSEEYVDAGIWKRGSLPYRLTGWAERRCLMRADAAAVLSEYRRREIKRWLRGQATVLPCAVDIAHFAPDPVARERIRSELGVSGLLLVYSGKAGGWYRTEDMLDFAKVAADILGPLSLLVLTTGDPDRFAASAAARGLRCVVRRADRAEMPGYLSAGDVGLSFRLDTPSQKACSPIKNGEYLACGLPIVTTPGAGDYSELVERERVGVVVEQADARAYRRAAEVLRELLADPGLRARCRAVAAREIGLSEVVLPRYLRIYEGLLGPPPKGRA